VGRQGIQSRARLVHEQHFWLPSDGAGDTQALLLSARQGEGALLEAVLHLFPQGRRPQAPLASLIEDGAVPLAVDPQRVDDVLVYALRERVRALEHHSHALSQVDYIDVRAVDGVAVQAHIAFDPHGVDQVVQAVYAALKGGLPAARRPDERRYLSRRDRHVDGVERLRLPVPQAEAFNIKHAVRGPRRRARGWDGSGHRRRLRRIKRNHGASRALR